MHDASLVRGSISPSSDERVGLSDFGSALSAPKNNRNGTARLAGDMVRLPGILTARVPGAASPDLGGAGAFPRKRGPVSGQQNGLEEM